MQACYCINCYSLFSAYRCASEILVLHALQLGIFGSDTDLSMQCLINHWTLKNLWEVEPACDWAVDMNKCYPQVYLADSNRCLNRQYKHWVNDGNNIKYLHTAKASWQQKRDCLFSKVDKTWCNIVYLSIGQLLVNN